MHDSSHAKIELSYVIKERVAAGTCCSQSQISDFSSAAKFIYLRWNIEKSVHKQLLKVIYQPMQ